MSAFALVADRFDHIMAENTANGGGLKISPGLLAVLLFLGGQLVCGVSVVIGGVWWASAMNTKMDAVIVGQSKYEDLERRTTKLETLFTAFARALDENDNEAVKKSIDELRQSLTTKKR